MKKIFMTTCAICAAASLVFSACSPAANDAKTTPAPTEEVIDAVPTAQPDIIQPEIHKIILDDTDFELLSLQCLYLPDFADQGSLDETFFKDYIFLSYTSPGGYPAETGDEDHMGYMWSVVPEEDVRAMVLLYLGTDMPECHFEYDDENPYIFYRDGSYLVNCSDFGDIEYVLSNSQVDGSTAEVYFDAVSS